MREIDMAEVQACAAGIIFDEAHRVLLVKRGRAPDAGSWSVPGGRCLPGELAEQACIREVAEETGLVVRVLRLAGSVHRQGPADVTYAIDDFVCDVIGGALQPGDDAADARWVSREGLENLPLVPGLKAALEGWGLLPD
jgi:8-oxo-dGTP diphosphatase